MVTRKRATGNIPGLDHFPVNSGDQPGMKYLIAAVFAAGKDGCECEACKLLKRFGGELSTMVLEAKENGSD